MKIAKWLTNSAALLKRAGISTARLDCLILLEDVLQKNRAFLFAHDDDELSTTQLSKLDAFVTQRRRHIPLAYIRQKTEFFGRTFIVTPAVLEPRPESETIIELLLQEPVITSVIDVGCGSGALGITTKLELPRVSVTAIDLDPACLKVTRQNAAQLRADITTMQNDLLTGIKPETIQDAHIVANLPYVPDDYALNEAALHEPRLAIFGGPDGLDLYRALFAQLQGTRPAAILCESLPMQHQALAAIALQHGFTLRATHDFIQYFYA